MPSLEERVDEQARVSRLNIDNVGRDRGPGDGRPGDGRPRDGAADDAAEDIDVVELGGPVLVNGPPRHARHKVGGLYSDLREDRPRRDWVRERHRYPGTFCIP